MKKTSKKLISLLLAVAIMVSMFVIIPLSADADSFPGVLDSKIATIDFWVGVEDAQAGGDLGTVRAHTVTESGTGTYYLFLPSQADLNKVKLYYSGSDECTLTYSHNSATRNITVTNGLETDAFAAGINGSVTYKLLLNGTIYNLLVYKSSNIGTVYFNTESGNTDNIDYGSDNTEHTVSERGTIMVVDENGGIDYDGVLEKIQGRGNGTWDADAGKLPYNIKLQNSASLLGMSNGKKWTLIANCNDTSLIKNWLSYDFSKYIGVPNQVIGKPVDVYANGKYMGNYLLCEKVEIKSNRIDVSDSYEALEIANGSVDPTTGVVTPADFANLGVTSRVIDVNNSTVVDVDINLELANSYSHAVGSRKYSCYREGTTLNPVYTNLNDPADLTGGYLYELEISNRWPDENAGFCGYNRQGWVIKSHDYASRHQVDYSYNLLYALGSSIYNDGVVPNRSTTTNCSGLSLITIGIYGARSITNPAPSIEYQGKKWSDLLDAKSAVTYYWTQEYFKNMDSSASSTYFFKDSDSVDSMLYAGPVWDMDNSIGYELSGSRWGYSWTSSDGWYTRNSRIYRWRAGDSSTSYNKDTQSPLSFYGALATNCDDFWDMAKDSWYETVKPATKILTGSADDPTGTLKSVDEYVDTIADSGRMERIRYQESDYDSEAIKSGIKNWLSSRAQWIDSQFGTLDISNASVSAVPDCSYTGSEIKPQLEVTYSNDVQGVQTLEEGVNYTLEYKNNVEVGTAVITINGIGRYAGSSKQITFNIVPADISSGSLTIYDAAYIGDEIVPTLLNSDGVEITGGVKYDWYSDSNRVFTGASYTVSADDAGKPIYAVATGDGVSVNGTLTSNSCSVAQTSRPDGTLKNIATFSYKFGDDGLSLQGGKNDGYYATSGIQKDTARIHASVDGVNYEKLEWSGSDTFIRTDGTSGQQPVMSPSGTTYWQEYPYFDITFSTVDYNDITFSADIGATSKGAACYALMYSVNSGEFQYFDDPSGEYDYMYYELTALDKKTMRNAFNATLPEVCENAETVTVRVVIDAEYTLEGNDTLFTTTKDSGKIAINNVVVNGVKKNDVTGLDAPVIETTAQSLYSDDTVIVSDTNAGADVYYTLTYSDGTVTSAAQYTDKFAPFENVKTETVTVTAWSEQGIYKSREVTRTYAFAGDALARFNYQTYSSEVVNGAMPSNGGAFDQSSKLKTVADGTSQYVPLYNADKKAIALSPDDGLKWTENSGFYFEVQTGGYDNITFSCDAYTTAQGPNSMALSYSLDGEKWTPVTENVKLPANGAIENYLDRIAIPGAENASVVYIRLTTSENLTSGGAALHNNLSKGNVYINNIIIGGEEIPGVLKTPYTNKSTDYFGPTGVVKYVSPDSQQMQYTVQDSEGKVVSSGSYPQSGLQLSSMPGFSPYKFTAYTVSVWAVDDEESSAANIRTYYYKGNTIAEFDYNTSRFDSSVSEDRTSVSATTGTGSVSMYPNGQTPAVLDYTSSYGLKVSASADNTWASNSKLDDPQEKGCWLIKTSTIGCTDLTLSIEQVSSSKGPRDWGIAYSTDGVNYTYVDNSNVRAIEYQQTVETYSNIALPKAVENQENVYIKVFINGGENIAGYEYTDPDNSLGKGNTGINNIELCGITPPEDFPATITTTVLENVNDTTGKTPLAGVDVYVDGELVGTTDSTGNITCMLTADKTYTILLDNGSFNRTVTVTGGKDISLNVPMVALDLVKDGYINGRDYVMIDRLNDSEAKELFERIFMEFLNKNEKTFQYAPLS